jgi:DNA repair protein RecN (Recombination protein N)
MLACRAVLAELDEVPTLVFDEVDAGIGGRTAIAVAERLAAVARTRQVLVVTHLAQIAARADRHFLVTKADGSATVRLMEGNGSRSWPACCRGARGRPRWPTLGS